MTERSEGTPGARAPASRPAMGSGGAAPEQAPTDVVVRPAGDDDAAAIRDLRQAWTEEDRGAPIDDPAFDAAFAAWWAAERAHRRYWVAEVDGDVVGVVSVVTMTRMPRPASTTQPWGYVHNLVVLPAHRGAGIGAALMGAATDACRADGYEHLMLHPRDRAVPFYERLGFGPVTDLLRRRLER